MTDTALLHAAAGASNTSALLEPVRLGAFDLPNRVMMAPLTRARAGRDGVPTALMVEYYRQRAGAGLIISEATGISREGLGWPFAPGLWTDEQAAGWRQVTSAVHGAGGRIVAQLWHMGRVVHPDFNDGQAPVSASATTAPGHAHTYSGKQPYVEARAVDADELPRIVADYAAAATHAKAAGFDGVQVHAANGYLIDQFLRDGTNFRTDGYGGSIDNRIRLLREVTEAVAAVWGADRVAVRMSPNGESQGVDDANPEPLFTAAARALGDIDIAFIELREPGPDGSFGRTDVPKLSPAIRAAFSGGLVLNSDLDASSGAALVSEGRCDAVSFGRPYIANPDLVARIETGAAWARDDMRTWYSQGSEGYVDYPPLEG